MALLALNTLSSPLHAFARWLVRPPAHGGTPSSQRACAGPTQPVHPQGGLPRQTRLARGPVRAVRVVHVLDGSAPGGSGRLVIAGRMADVCAELDRLALREQAAH
jgi:hypothetical protein